MLPGAAGPSRSAAGSFTKLWAGQFRQRCNIDRGELTISHVSTAVQARNRDGWSLSVRDREIFLAEPHVAALSVAAGRDRGPFIVRIWYQYVPGGNAWVLTEAGSRKAELIGAAGRFSLMVDRVMPTVRYVSVEGPVTQTTSGTDALLREITSRYLPADKVSAYLSSPQQSSANR